MNESYRLLQKYVNSATDLAEGLERDIKNGKEISSDTVLRLSKFISAAHDAANLLDFDTDDGNTLQ